MTINRVFFGIISTLVFLSLFSGNVVAVVQPILFFNPDVVESNTGDNDQVILMMDGAARGLCGYGLVISIDNPDVAEITSLDLPVWVGLKDVRKINETAYLVQGTDISSKQDPGAIQIAIADITVHAKSPGYANLIATPVTIDDDEKGRYTSQVATGSIVITGAGPVPIIPMST